MFLRVFYLFLLFGVTAVLPAQGEYTVHAQLLSLPDAKSQGQETVWTTLGPTEDYAYIVGFTQGQGKNNYGANVSLYAISDDGVPPRRIDVPALNENKSVTYESVSLADGYINFFSSFVNKKTDKAYLMVQRLDAKTLNAAGEPQVLLTLSGTNDRNGNYFDITAIRQENRSHVVEYRIDGRGSRFDVHLAVLNEDLQLLHEHVIEGLDKEAYDRFYGVQATADGTLYYILSEGGDARRFKTDPGERYLYRVAPDGQSTRQRILSGGNTEPTAPRLNLRPDGSLLATGKYYDPGKKEYAGLYFNIYDGESLRVINSATTPLSLDPGGLLTNMSNGEALDKDGKKLLRHYRINDVLTTKDGGTYVVGEAYYREEKVARSTGYVYYLHQYRGLFVTRLDKTGSVEYFRHVPVGVEVNMRPGAQVLDGELLLTFYTEYKHRHNLTTYIDRVEDYSKHQLLWHVLLDAEGTIRSGGNRQFMESKPREMVDTHRSVLAPSGDAVYYYAFERDGRQILQVTLPQ